MPNFMTQTELPGQHHVGVGISNINDYPSLGEWKAVKSKLAKSEQKVKDLEIKNKLLNQELKTHPNRNKILREKFVSEFLVNLSYTPAQIRKIIHPERKHQREYDVQDVMLSIVVKTFSNKAFNYLRKQSPLAIASTRTIERWLLDIKTRPGFQVKILEILSKNLEFSGIKDSQAMLLFDEMSIKKVFQYSPALQQVFGPCSKVLVVILKGVVSSWKQPVFFAFDTPMTKTLLFDMITKFQSYNVSIRGIACDMGNPKLFAELSLRKINKFRNPCDDSKFVYFFPDAPHLLKRLRDNLFDHSFFFPSNPLKSKQRPPHKKNEDEMKQQLIRNGYTQICKEDFSEIVEKCTTELKYCVKLTQDHLDVSGQRRQNVRMASQTLSGTVAKAMVYVNPQKQAQSEFINIIDLWWDLMNGMKLYGGQASKSAYGTNLDEQDKILLNAEVLISNIVLLGKRAKLPFMDGILMSIKSTRELGMELRSEGYPFLLTRKLNQDSVENFFSIIRAMGNDTHPGPVEFIQRFHSHVLLKNRYTMVPYRNPSVQCRKSNYVTHLLIENLDQPENIELEHDELTIGNDIEVDTHSTGTSMQDVNKQSDHEYCILSREVDAATALIDLSSSSTISPALSTNCVPSRSANTLADDGLAYIGGYIARKMIKEFPELGELTKNATYRPSE